MERKWVIAAIVGASGGALAAIAALFFWWWNSPRRVDPLQEAWDQKLSQAEMVRYYEVTPDRPLRIALLPVDREMRIISHLTVPSDDPPDPEREYVYGLKVEFFDSSGTLIAEKTYWESTRKTRILVPGALLPWEAAFYFPPRGDHPEPTTG
ncbi:MAG: hypothetical protein KatS3mg115_2578 [Candidatus Poribacteria bacterium]|nr:MAG: hypothetical protein KatS3mg115_2578 [Candidatus Poribacteria bacterium]